MGQCPCLKFTIRTSLRRPNSKNPDNSLLPDKNNVPYNYGIQNDNNYYDPPPAILPSLKEDENFQLSPIEIFIKNEGDDYNEMTKKKTRLEDFELLKVLTKKYIKK